MSASAIRCKAACPACCRRAISLLSPRELRLRFRSQLHGFCDEDVDALIDRQSAEPNAEKRRQLVWEIERRLVRDASRPIIFYTRVATCWRPRVKGLNLVVNSVFNGWRFEDVAR